jgi:putative endonuclease
MQRNDKGSKSRPGKRSHAGPGTSGQHLGRRGEEVAAHWLEARGYRILDRNWRSGRQELDLVAHLGKTLVIAEVKTRLERPNEPESRPEEAVSAVKQRHLARAAQAYLAQLPGNWQLRFDVIAIRVRGERCRLFHQQDAFFPGL